MAKIKMLNTEDGKGEIVVEGGYDIKESLKDYGFKFRKHTDWDFDSNRPGNNVGQWYYEGGNDELIAATIFVLDLDVEPTGRCKDIADNIDQCKTYLAGKGIEVK